MHHNYSENVFCNAEECVNERLTEGYEKSGKRYVEEGPLLRFCGFGGHPNTSEFLACL